jgi:Skp family chaperone for outer membrane proteins
MFRVLQEVQESELVRQALEQYREEQQKIAQQKDEWRKRFEQGEITKKQLDEKLLELDLRLQELNLQLSAPIQREMLQIIREIGQEKGYSLIIDNPASQLNPVVLHSQAGQADDITQEVTQRLSAKLEKDGDEGSEGE